MSEELQIDNGYFSRLLALADLPEEIVGAYSDIRHLVVEHMKTYSKILKDDKLKSRVIAAAATLKGKGLTGPQVVKELRNAAEPKTKTTDACEFTVKRGRAGDYTIKNQTWKEPCINDRQHQS